VTCFGRCFVAWIRSSGSYTPGRARRTRSEFTEMGRIPGNDGAAKSGRGMRSDVFNPLCISPNLGGEELQIRFCLRARFRVRFGACFHVRFRVRFGAHFRVRFGARFRVRFHVCFRARFHARFGARFRARFRVRFRAYSNARLMRRGEFGPAQYEEASSVRLNTKRRARSGSMRKCELGPAQCEEASSVRLNAKRRARSKSPSPRLGRVRVGLT